MHCLLIYLYRISPCKGNVSILIPYYFSTTYLVLLPYDIFFWAPPTKYWNHTMSQWLCDSRSNTILSPQTASISPICICLSHSLFIFSSNFRFHFSLFIIPPSYDLVVPIESLLLRYFHALKYRIQQKYRY